MSSPNSSLSGQGPNTFELIVSDSSLIDGPLAEIWKDTIGDVLSNEGTPIGIPNEDQPQEPMETVGFHRSLQTPEPLAVQGALEIDRVKMNQGVQETSRVQAPFEVHEAIAAYGDADVNDLRRILNVPQPDAPKTVEVTWSNIEQDQEQGPTETEKGLFELIEDSDFSKLLQVKPTLQNPANVEVVDKEQDMLDPAFEDSQYVHKADDPAHLHTIKINNTVKLAVANQDFEDQDVLIGIYHSHPQFAKNTLQGVSKENIQDPAPNDTPFAIHHDSVLYKDINFPFLDMTMKGAVVSLKKERHIFIRFLLNSTDEKNHGNLKDAKEWHLLVIPISKAQAQLIRSTEKHSMEAKTCIPRSILRIQIKTEVRKNQKLTKIHRRVEVEWPQEENGKRKRLESLYIQAKKRKMATLSDQQLEAKIQKYNL